MGDSSTKADEDSFGFGFNDKDFSDRILRIKIIPKDSDDCVKTEVSLHVNSLVLASKSPFFYKLFKNGMIESQSKDVILGVCSSEKASVMELLKFMYQSALSATSTSRSDLLALLVAADKFEVTSCMRYCVQLLLKMCMSLDLALSYLELPSTVLAAEVVKPLVVASKRFLTERYKDFNKLTQEEALALPLVAVEFVLGSEGLKVDSEDDVFEFILKWSRRHYLEPNERQKIITKNLVKLIYFQYMSCTKLKEVLVCDEFQHEDVTNLVMDALFFKVEVPYGSTLGRLYKYPLIKVIKKENPMPQCVVFFDLKKEECENLFSSEATVFTQSFLLGGRYVFFSTRCEKKPEGSSERFGLYVRIEKDYETCDFEFAAMKKSTMKFESQRKANNCIVGRNGTGYDDVFGITWSTFMSDDSDYFIDDILHLRVELTIINSQA